MTKASDVIIYKTEDGTASLKVRLDHETVWLDAHQMALLFGRDRTVIVRHLKNVYETKELERKSTSAKNAQVAADGKVRQMDIYNLDMILSVGYRVNSKRGTQFRQWATKTPRDHLVRGYTVNEQRMREQAGKLADLRRTVTLLEKTIAHQIVGLDEAKGLLNVITDYAYALTTLDRYDHGALSIEATTKPAYVLDHASAEAIVAAMKGEFGGLFGVEKDEGFKSALATIYQTFGGKDLYPSVEEKAANLLYFIVKNHAFIDGNKRIAAAIFVYFLAGNGILYRSDGSKRIADNALVALTLLIAESKPEEKDTIAKVIVNLINRRND
ncbi:MAG TPA: cytochrome C biogenesis protein CycH [Nitrospiraceae bacterium]|nr:cytochrome C biogenesis protein CycH [Nitrospiraceae bacterium]